ncbi:histone H1 [Sphingobacteriaceae bacterium WQ 2009]|uniref:Histone H1 n=1 Tax=Rhinopithecimicrobium faecis TaxID=2820698 RepID=A0A8T4HD27_9SPHI|nr:histone H1 [Sphingobacteriaceae bacterium WQ 2009]
MANLDKFQELKNIVHELAADVDKFYVKGNAAAGTRVRKSLQDIKNLSQEIRVEIQNSKNAK